MKTYIWALPLRFFHWFLAFGFAATYLLGDFEEFHNFHFGIGLFVGTLLIFRILYGFFGNKYAHFRDFPISPKNQIEFIKTFFGGTKTYAGHNPAASVVMISIFLVGICCSISGFLLYNTEYNSLINIQLNEDFLEETHEILANLFLALVIFHLLGLLADAIFHSKTKTAISMFSGYKNIDAENTKLNAFQKIFFFLWFLTSFAVLYWGTTFKTSENENNNQYINNQRNNYNNSEHEDEEHEEDEDDD